MISEQERNQIRQEELQNAFNEKANQPMNANEAREFDLQCRIDLASRSNKQDGIREIAVDKRVEQIVEDLQREDAKRGESEEEFKESLLTAQQKYLKYRRQANEIAMKELQVAMQEGRI